MSRSFSLPSGERATRYYNRAKGGVRYALHGTPVVLSIDDIEALYADSIAGDGGRELRERRERRNEHVCTLPLDMFRRWHAQQPRTAVCSHPCPIVCEQEHPGPDK